MGIVTLLTDFGTSDYYVGAVKGTLLRLAPGSQIIDLSHEISPGDLQGAAFLLTAAARSFPPSTVHLSVIDPGVGSDRRILVAESGGMTFVAPDNGILSPILRCQAPWEETKVYAVDRPDLYLPSPGATFHGRDRFAPIAAYLLRGGLFGNFLRDPVLLQDPPPHRADSHIDGRVIHVDQYGNLVTNIPTTWLEEHFQYAEVQNHRVRHRVACYAELPQNEPGVIPGSLGTLEISLDGASLARRWNISRDVSVRFVLSC